MKRTALPMLSRLQAPAQGRSSFFSFAVWQALLCSFLLLGFTGLNAQTVVNISGATTASWTAPATGGPYYVRITARGGDGGTGFNFEYLPTRGGQGATLSGTFAVPAGQTILAISGASGGSGGAGGGGGGAGAVNATTGTLLLLAGGGSGGHTSGHGWGLPALPYPGTGNGGASCNNYGGGGGGLNSAGASGPSGGGGGGQVSLTGLSAGGSGANGGGSGGRGMGGGGGAASDIRSGGGGGQTGGSISCYYPAQSQPGGTCQSNFEGGKADHPSKDGFVTIELLAPVTYYRDADGDGFGDATNTTTNIDVCSPTGYVANSTDCDDTKVTYEDKDGDGFGGNTKVACNGVSNNGDCDDTNPAIVPTTLWVLDQDRDGAYGGEPVLSCTSPGPGYVVKPAQAEVDCDDTDRNRYPGAADIPDDGIDQNCDGYDLKTWYQDSDGDGFGNAPSRTRANTQPEGYVNNSTDCDDTRTTYADNDGDGYGSQTKVACQGVPDNTDCDDANPAISPNTLWVLDSDTDGFYTGNPVAGCTSPGTGYQVKGTKQSGDCNDNNAAINSGAIEISDDGTDQDCDGFDRTTWYRDGDGDGYGTASNTIESNTQPLGFVSNKKDCDDGNAAVHSAQVYYVDADGDGYGSATTALLCSATAPAGYATANGDCNDGDAAIYPGAADIADDGLDQDCDGFDKKTFYKDNDGDGFGDNATTLRANTQPSGYVTNNSDCNDGDATINPTTVWVLDRDGDNYYSGSPATQCTSPGAGYVVRSTQQPGDCSDNNSAVSPGAVEVCGNGMDDNCNGAIDENCSSISVTILPSFICEGDKGTRTMIFLVGLNKPAPSTLSVRWQTSDGTAKAASDYKAASGTVTFTKGQWIKLITVIINGDKTVENNEQFTVQLSSPSSGLKINSTGKVSGTILDDDKRSGSGYSIDANGYNSKLLTENKPLVVPNLLHRSQTWRIPSLPAGNEVMVFDQRGRLVWKTLNYNGGKAFRELPVGLYFYHIIVSESGQPQQVLKGKLMIVE